MAFMAAAAPYLLAAGTAMSAYSVLSQGRAESMKDEFLAKQGARNAENNAVAAMQAQQEAKRNADQLDVQRRKIIGEQTAAAGASGLTVSGSVADVMNDTAIQMETEIQMAKYRGQIESYNYGQRAINNMSQANMYRLSGSSAKSSATWTAAGTVLNGAATYGMIKYWKQ